MKTKLFLLLFILCGTYTFAGNGYDVTFDKNNNAYQLHFMVEEISVSSVEIDGQIWSVIDFPGSVVTKKAGFAELPFIAQSIKRVSNAVHLN